MNSYVTINTERNEIIAIGISTVDLSKLQKMDKGMVAKIDKVISFTQTAGSGI
jgi:PUA domain.